MQRMQVLPEAGGLSRRPTKVKAQTAADVKKIEAEAEAEADANKKLAESITEELIRMKEAEARLKHGWVTITGASTVVTTK